MGTSFPPVVTARLPSRTNHISASVLWAFPFCVNDRGNRRIQV